VLTGVEDKSGSIAAAGSSIAFVGGFNDAGGGRYAVANFAAEAARLNPGASIRFFPWNSAGSLSAWITRRPRTTAVIGQSLGGHIAAKVAVANPGRIETLLTIDAVSPPSLSVARDFTWANLRESVERWFHVVQRRNRILALAAQWWGDAPAPFADGFASTNFSHGDFFSTMQYLKNTGRFLPEQFNWNVLPR
jgi:pimeloyl-ACP methyl ester carboxylesterase